MKSSITTPQERLNTEHTVDLNGRVPQAAASLLPPLKTTKPFQSNSSVQAAMKRMKN
jgi:hypothetical protein